MTEPLDTERSHIQLENIYTNRVELYRLVPSVIGKMVDERLSEGPEWFMSDMVDIKSSSEGINHQITSLKTDMVSQFARIDSRFVTLEHNHLCMFNFIRRMVGYDVVSVPFLNREENHEELPPVLSVKDIDGLTKEQCQRFLRGYNIEFHANETIKLKERLRDAVGLMVSSDRDYRFAPFTT